MRTAHLFRGCLAAIALSQAMTAGPISSFVQTNLVSDIPGLAANTDSALANPWGMSSTWRQVRIWGSDNGAGLCTLDNGSGVKQIHRGDHSQPCRRRFGADRAR